MQMKDPMKKYKTVYWLALCVSALCPLCLCGSLLFSAEPGRDKLDQTVAQALSFLRRTQSTEGCWKSSGFGSDRNAGITGLCVMAFLSAGQTPAEGEHARAVA